MFLDNANTRASISDITHAICPASLFSQMASHWWESLMRMCQPNLHLWIYLLSQHERVSEVEERIDLSNRDFEYVFSRNLSERWYRKLILTESIRGQARGIQTKLTRTTSIMYETIRAQFWGQSHLSVILIEPQGSSQSSISTVNARPCQNWAELRYCASFCDYRTDSAGRYEICLYLSLCYMNLLCDQLLSHNHSKLILYQQKAPGPW